MGVLNVQRCKGYWYDNAWIKDDDKDYYDGYPYQYSW